MTKKSRNWDMPKCPKEVKCGAIDVGNHTRLDGFLEQLVHSLDLVLFGPENHHKRCSADAQRNSGLPKNVESLTKEYMRNYR